MVEISRRISFLILVVSLLILGINGQYSLDEMIENMKRENGIVFETQSQQQQEQVFVPQPELLANRYSFDDRYNPAASNLISRNILQLAQNIGRHIANEDTRSKTQVFSPISIAGAMSLLLLGSNGQTFNELMRLFGYDRESVLQAQPYKIHEEYGFLIEDLLRNRENPNRPSTLPPWKHMQKLDYLRAGVTPDINVPVEDYHKIEISNGLFVQNGYSLRPNYKTAVQDVYMSQIKSLDFSRDSSGAKSYINNWVKEKTHGRISEIISGELRPDTRLIVASALYFKALWEKTFIDGATNIKNFYPDGINGTAVPVEMMAHGGVFPFYDAQEYGCRILGLPYKGNLSTMYVILPYDSNRIKLREIQSILTPDRIDEMINKMQLKTAIMLFPKMHISHTLNLKHILLSMGVQSLFNDVRSDLSLISSGRSDNFRPLSVTNVNNMPFNPQFNTQMNPQFNPQPNTQFNSQPIHQTNIQFNPQSNTQFNPQPIQQANPQYNPQTISQNNPQLRTPYVPKREPIVESRGDQLIFASGPEAHKIRDPTHQRRAKRQVKYKVESSFRRNADPLRIKDFIINKRITKANPGKKLLRGRRQVEPEYSAIKQLDMLRNSPGLSNPHLFAEEIIHKIDLTVNEKGTEGGAATVVYLTRTGTDVVFRVETPFMFLIRHDATKLPLFYGSVYEPTNF